MNVSNQKMPTYDAMMRPTIQALKELGGSGNTEEIFRKVSDILGISDDVLTTLHGDTSQSEVEYRLAWSRTYLKKVGIISNSVRGVWALTSNEIEPGEIDPREIVQKVNSVNRRRLPETTPFGTTPAAQVSPSVEVSADSDPDVPEEIMAWHERLHQVLLGLSPAAFERLAQRLLRESGFIDVEVTGRTNDGGIDGIGTARVSGFLSFRVLFQCKRYQGTISSSQIRDFRGAMVGRTDSGLFITTGAFTREAVKEATRDGAPTIDLIDGEQLVQRLKELRLGVKIELVEAITVDDAWFVGL